MKAKWTKADKNKIYSITRQYIDELEKKGFIVRTLDKIEFTHSFHRHGYCRTYKYNSLFDLGISAYRLADGWQAVRETILHELCHAIAPYGAGHGKEWQEIADEVGKIYGIKIQRCDPHSITVDEIAYRYVAKCDKCGATWHYMRKTKFIKAVMENHASTWKCACGGNHFSMVKGGN